MALKKQYEVSPGLVASEAYICVNNVNIVRGEPAGATVHVYGNSDTSLDPLRVLCYGFEYRLDAGNPIAQAYEHLKTLPEFADAVDC